MLPSMLRQTLFEIREGVSRLSRRFDRRAGWSIARGVECLGGSVSLSGFDASSSLRGASL